MTDATGETASPRDRVGAGPAGSAGYRVPDSVVRAEQTVKRSRFIATVGRAPDPDVAAAAVRDARLAYPDATHHCWAFIAGPPASTASIGLSDDGEPHGSAGRPMLTVLLHSGIGEIVAVVTRYYGGTNLGVGGLVRAYGGTLQLALDRLDTVEFIRQVDLVVELDYASVMSLRHLVAAHAAAVVEELFGEHVTCRVRLPAGRAEEFTRALGDVTAGRARVAPAG